MRFKLIEYERQTFFYVLPNPINERMDFPMTVARLEAEAARSKHMKFYVENVGYQSALPQVLRQRNIKATGVTPQGDKRARLNLAAPYIEQGYILFPRSGCEELITQLKGFGVEKHDDLVDALTLVVQEVTAENAKPKSSIRIGTTNLWTAKPGERIYFR